MAGLERAVPKVESRKSKVECRMSNVAWQSAPARQLSRKPAFAPKVSNEDKCRPAMQREPSFTYDCLLAVEIDNIYCQRWGVDHAGRLTKNSAICIQ